MKLSFRTKIVCISVGILFLSIGSTAFISSYLFQKEYSNALRSELSVIGQSVKAQLDRLLALDIPVEELTGFEQQCRDVVETYQDASYALVENPAGVILFHNDPAQHGKAFHEFVAAQQEKNNTIAIPVLDAQNTLVATVKIGYPVKLVEQKVHRLILSAIGVAAISLVLAIILLLAGIFVWVNKPLKELSQSAAHLSVGDTTCIVRKVPSHDEIGILSNSFSQLIAYFREMSQVAANIAEGNLSGTIQPKADHDTLGHAFLHMLSYLGQLSRMMTNIAAGDLTERITIRSSSDTFGRVMHAMTEGLCALVTRIRMSAEQIASTGSTIESLATHDIEIVQKETASVGRMVDIMTDLRTSFDEVSSNMEVLSSSTENVSASIGEMTASIGHIASNTTNLTHQTQETIAALHDTIQTLEHVVGRTENSRKVSQDTHQEALRGKEAVEQVISSMEKIHHTVMTAVEVINRFSKRSQDIDEILEVIRNITEQTSLLALNASIIAAQAGVHGRGFAVVADEIKNLAQGVALSTKDIASIVGTLKQDTENVVLTIHEGASTVKQGVEHTQQARETLDTIINSAQHSSLIVTEIAESLHELMLTGQQLSGAMQKVNLMTDDITSATTQQKTVTEQINRAIGDIHLLTTATLKATIEQTQGVQQLLHTAEEMSGLMSDNQNSSQHITQTSEVLSSQSKLLLEEVDRFKLPE